MLNGQQHKTLLPKLVVLFGSQASGKIRDGSDFDVAVLGDKPLGLQEKLDLMSVVARQHNLPEDEIDLVDLQSASPLLQMQVAKTGRLLSGTKKDWQIFQWQAVKRYENTKKFRTMRQNYLAKKYG